MRLPKGFNQKPRKYRNNPVVIDGIKFDSDGEAKRWFDLQTLERAGEISSLERQPKYDLEVNGVKICTYKADFRYTWVKGLEAGKNVVEDFKSKATITPVFRLKKKLMLACHGIEITLTGIEK